MLLFSVFDELARAAVEAALNGLWQAFLLAGIAWTLLKVFRGANAATRHLIWLATFAAVAGLPLIPAPERHPGGLQLLTETLSESAEPIQKGLVTDDVAAPGQDEYLPDEQESDEQSPGRAQIDDYESVEAAGTPLSRVRNSATQNPMSPSPKPIYEPTVLVASPGSLRLIFLSWLAVSAFFIARVTLSYRHIRRVKASCIPIGGDSPVSLRKWAGPQPGCRAAVVTLAPDIRMPMAIGLRAPLVALPEELSRSLPENELDQVILHELAHIQRRDDWANLTQKVIEALLFFNPVVLWISKRLCLEREIACDDRVITRTGQPRSYAVCLTMLAGMTSKSIRPTIAPGALLGASQLSRRIEMLLSKRRNTSLKISRFSLLVVAAFLFASIIEFKRVGPLIALAHRAEPADVIQRGIPDSPSLVPAIEYRAGQERTGDKGSRDAKAEQELRELAAQQIELEREIRREVDAQQRELEERVRESVEKTEREIEARMRELEPKLREMEKEQSETARRLEREAEEQLRESSELLRINLQTMAQGEIESQRAFAEQMSAEQRAEAEKQLRESMEQRAREIEKMRESLEPRQRRLQEELEELHRKQAELRRQLEEIRERERTLRLELRETTGVRRQEINRETRELINHKMREMREQELKARKVRTDEVRKQRAKLKVKRVENKKSSMELRKKAKADKKKMRDLIKEEKEKPKKPELQEKKQTTQAL